jgi:mannosyltransferase
MALLVLILLFAFALRLYRLGYQSLWYDEAVSIHLATQDLRSLTQHTAGDIHPPLYYYLLHFWVRVAGSSEFSAAFLSLIFGILIIAGCYRLGADVYGRPAGLLAAFLLALSPFNLWYSQEVRMYTLGAFLGLISLYCLMRLAGLTGRTGGGHGTDTRSQPGSESRVWRFWLGYILSAAAGLYTLYYFTFLLLFENLFVVAWWLAARHRRQEQPLGLGRWALAQVLVLVLYAPWLPVAVRQALYPPVPPWRGFTGLGAVIVESWTALSLGQSVDANSLLVWPVLSFMFALYLLGLLSAARGDRGWARSSLLGGYTVAPLLVIYLLSWQTPLFHVRYAFTYSPPFYLLVALGLVELGRRWRAALPVGLAVIGLACGYSIYRFHFDPQYAADDHRGAVSYLERRIAPGDAVLINAGYAYPPFLYYYHGEIAWRGRLVDYQPDEEGDGLVLVQTGTVGGEERLGWGDPASDFYATDEEETAQALERLFAHHDRVWVYRIYDTVTDPHGFIRSWLEEHGRLLGEEEFAGESYMRVQCYLTAREPEYDADPVYHSLGVDVAEGVKLAGFRAPLVVRAGDDLSVDLDWQAEGEVGAALEARLGLTLEGADLDVWTDVVASTTLAVDATSAPQVVEVPIPPGTPPVEYSLVLDVYDPSTQRGADPPWAGSSIGSVRVMRPLVPPPTPRMTYEPWANFGDLVQLTGYELFPPEVQPGSTLDVQLYWRAWGVPLPLMETRLELRGVDGSLVSVAGGCLSTAYPSINWAREELVRDLCAVEVPQAVSSGRYELDLRLEALGAAGAWEAVPFWSPAGWGDSFALARIEVVEP